MAGKELKNKPLVEAILDLKWEIPPIQATSFEGDPHYRLLLGRFFDRVKTEYPEHEPLASAQVPDALVQHTPQHRFRKSKDGWPLLQLGHGIMTVNETSGYIWDDFKARCETAVKDFYESHPAKEEVRIKELMLRYVDAIALDWGRDDVFAFINTHMKTSIGLSKGLFADGLVNPIPASFQWETGYETRKPAGKITLKFAIGRRKKEPALILETRVHSTGDVLPPLPGGFADWLKQAHDLTDAWFFHLIEGELEKRFS